MESGSAQPRQYLLKTLFVVGAEGFCAAVDNVTATDADGREAGEQDRDDPRPAVFDTHDRMTLFERDAEADTCGFGIEPRVWLGRQLAQRARFTFADGMAGRDDGIVEFVRIAHIERLERIEDFRPGFFVETGGDKSDFYAEIFELIQEIFDARDGVNAPFLCVPLLFFNGLFELMELFEIQSISELSFVLFATGVAHGRLSQ